MYGYPNMMPPWWMPPTPNYPPIPPISPTPGMSMKDFIRTWKAWEKFIKQQEEDKKKKEDKKPSGPQLKAWEVFVIMTCLSPIIGPVLSKLTDVLLKQLQ